MKSNGKNKKSRREFLKKTALGAAAAGAANLAAQWSRKPAGNINSIQNIRYTGNRKFTGRIESIGNTSQTRKRYFPTNSKRLYQTIGSVESRQNCRQRLSVLQLALPPESSRQKRANY
jgi:hypothetical protein